MFEKLWKTTQLMAFILICFGLLSACAGAASSESEVKITDKENGSKVEIQKGQTLVVTLPANPSTGYSWEVVGGDESILKTTGEPVFEQANQSSTPIVGAGGTQTFKLTSLQAGSRDLKLIYHRPWEKDVPPEKTFTVQVVVK